MTNRRLLSMPLWPVRNQGGDPFGPGVLDEISALEGLELICDAKEKGLVDMWSAHDCDIYPWDPNDPEDYLHADESLHKHLQKMKKMADAAGLKMNIITCNLHGNSLFANGGFTNPDPAKRLLATKKALRAAWIGNFLGAQGVTYWTARDGFEVAPAVHFQNTGKIDDMIKNDGPYQWLARALDLISAACEIKKYSIKFGTIEPKGNEPRGVTFIPLVGSALALISQLKNPDFWGVNPEVPQHSAMCLQEPLLEIVQAAERNKLPFIHFGGQIDGQFDNDFPPLFGPTNLKRMVQIFLYLEEICWNGIVEFDCHPLRSDTAPGTKNSIDIRCNFIRDCVKMYRMAEQILVPRIRNDFRLARARAQIWSPDYLKACAFHQYEAILADEPTLKNITEIENISIDAQAALKNPASCGNVDKAFMLAMLDISDDDIKYAIKKEE